MTRTEAEIQSRLTEQRLLLSFGLLKRKAQREIAEAKIEALEWVLGAEVKA